jgi:electron transfer flavoprotein beta subunit
VDTLGTAKILAAMIRPLAPDLILAGKQAVDYDEMAVGIMLAELLDLPHVAVVTKLEMGADGTSFTAHREIEGAVEEVACSLPAVVTTQKGLNEPRYASLKGIMAAKKKTIETLEPAALGLDLAALSGSARSWSLAGWASPPARSRGKILTGEAKESARELVRLLHEEAKII